VAEQGFPDGSRWTPVPDLFFSRYLPELGDASAAGLALLAMWRIHRRKGNAPAATRAVDLESDAVVARYLRSLGVSDVDVPRTVAAALDQLVAAGLLLEARTAGEGGPARWVFVNDHDGRATHRQWQEGGLILPELPTGSADQRLERPSVFKLYEENMGPVSPLIVDELRAAAETYPESWIEDAVRQAVANNARTWSYVEAILKRWASEGRADDADRRRAREARERDADGPYAAFVKH